MKLMSRALALLATIVCWCPAQAADDWGSATKESASPRLAEARLMISRQDWSGALKELTRLDDRSSADWNNLMGYVSRKKPVPDFDTAQRHYDQALRIDPRHRRALAYSGELFLQLHNLPMARQRLQALRAACETPCPEHAELASAIDRYRADNAARATVDKR